MDLEKKTFPNGRHRNKTYLWVYQNDKDFCQVVMSGEKSPFIPEDFSDFLCTKIEHFSTSAPHSVAERKGRDFVRKFDEELKSQFRDVIGKLEIKRKQVHSSSNTIELTNGFLGVFYRFFVLKHVANITNVNAYREIIHKYVEIFPFPVSDLVAEHEIDIVNVIEDELELLDEMQAFLNEHFDDVEIRSVSRKFFSNIFNCKQNNVTEKAISAAVRNIDLKGLSAKYNFGYSNLRFGGNEKCEYLKTYPRVNRNGVKRYQRMYDMIVDVSKLYEKPCNVPAFKYETNYLLKLPEINFYELYSLLNVDFLQSDREEYVYRFKKYLFFFINALNSPSKPVFFIDDGLFECLLHYNTFRKSRDDVETLTFELSMLTLVNLRKHPFDQRGTFHLDINNLKDVKNYFDNFPGITNALISHEIRTEVLESTAFVLTERVVLDICFRERKQQSKDFFELIIQGALSSNNFERLVIYNAFTGEERSVAMPTNKDAIIEFIRKYNKYDFSQTEPPEKFITSGFERYYVRNVAMWDSKKKFKCLM